MSRNPRADLAAWIQAFRDLGADFLETAPELPPVSPPASAARDPRPASCEPGRAEPASRPELRGAFPAQMQILSDPELEPLGSVQDGGRGLEQIRSILGECTRCRLHEGRNNLVFGIGSPRAEIFFVGEGPGREEDRQGEPFVGRAGRKLDEMIAGMGYSRDQVYIANVVKCRPPQNRTPQSDEADTCAPFLHAQIAAVRPRILVALGLPATQALLGVSGPMKALRGRFHDYRGVPVMPTYHPAYLLRSPGENRKVAHDLALVMRHLGRELPSWAAKALREDSP